MEGSGSSLIEGTILAFVFWETTISLRQDSGLRAKIWNRDVPNSKQECQQLGCEFVVPILLFSSVGTAAVLTHWNYEEQIVFSFLFFDFINFCAITCGSKLFLYFIINLTMYRWIIGGTLKKNKAQLQL
jgi:hypothetical protein